MDNEPTQPIKTKKRGRPVGSLARKFIDEAPPEPEPEPIPEEEFPKDVEEVK